MKSTISQKRTTDCGVACIKFITGEPYGKIEKIVKNTTGGTLRTYEEDIRSVLRELGFKLKYRFSFNIKNWPSIRNRANLSLALVGINYNKSKWHWVMYKKSIDSFWDPLFGKYRTDFRSGTKFRSFLRI